MIAIGHTSVGVLVGLASNSLLPTSLPLWQQVAVVGMVGLISHYIADVLPHGHYDFEGASPSKRSTALLTVDLVLPILIVAIVCLWRFGLGSASWLIAAGIAGAQAPDVFDGLLARGYMAHSRLAANERAFHLATHWHNPIDPSRATPQGGRRLAPADAWQAFVALLALFILFIY